jgi:hypothetical protein
VPKRPTPSTARIPARVAPVVGQPRARALIAKGAATAAQGVASAIGPDLLDAPTAGDRVRLRRARREARARVLLIETAREDALLAAFRAEVGAVVRSASPLLVSLLADEGLTLDGVVALIRPLVYWPARPRLSGRLTGRRVHPHLLRYHMIGLSNGQLSEPPLHCHMIERADGGYLIVQVADHSVELNALIGRLWLETRFGELRVEFMDPIPETIFTASVGHLIEEIVDHHALRGRGWRIVAIQEPTAVSGQALVVAMGSVEYRMPWMP